MAPAGVRRRRHDDANKTEREKREERAEREEREERSKRERFSALDHYRCAEEPWPSEAGDGGVNQAPAPDAQVSCT